MVECEIRFHNTGQGILHAVVTKLRFTLFTIFTILKQRENRTVVWDL